MSIYETHRMKDARLPFIFHKSTHIVPDNAFRAGNWHENMELLLFTGGSGLINYDTEQFAVASGDIIVINSNCFHDFKASDKGLDYHCLIVDRSFCLSNGIDTNKLRFVRRPESPAIAQLVLALADEYPLPSPLPAATVPMIRAYVLQILALLCRFHTEESDEAVREPHLLSCVKRAIGLIRAESARDLTLDELAAFVGLSKFYFARQFRCVTGYTIVNYINLTRCERAKQLLTETDMSVGEVGRNCGFSNNSYFSKTFRMHTGVLPAKFRQQHTDTENAT